MARIFPDVPPTHLPNEAFRVFRALKALPDSFVIWHHLAPWQPDAPDFLLRHQEMRVLLVKVSTAAARPAISAAQLTLLAGEQPPLGEAEARVLAKFVAAMRLPDPKMTGTLVVFPNIGAASLPSRDTTTPDWAGKELLEDSVGEQWLQFFPATSMDALWLEKVRQQFTPETVIPAEMTVRPPTTTRLAAGLTGYLLDYDQEWAVKADLNLPEDSKNLSNDFRLNIINGVAGSGKTLILLHRLRLLYHLYPHKRFLVLTHNRALSHDMEARFFRLENRLPNNIEWRTFYGWCYHHWHQQHIWREPLGQIDRKNLVEQIWRAHLQHTSLSAAMFLSEIDWLKDQLPMSLEAYLQADRRGRGFGLNAEQRSCVYAAFEDYQQTLAERQTLDWGDVPRLLWGFLESGTMQLPQYDVILIDEAQFFAPLWMRLIQKLLNPHNGHLFIVADPTQGFLGRGASWKSLGLAAHGRTHHLRRSYRTTQEIMNFATLLYRTRLSDEDDDDILPPDMLNMPSGVLPQVIRLASPQDEITRVANEVAAIVKQGYPKRNLLLLHTNPRGVRSLIQAINRQIGKDAARDPKDDYPGNYVRVTTLNAVAGLESPIVFLVGLRDLFDAEQSLRIAEAEREELIRDNTRKLYMAITRAGQRLVITYVGEAPQVLAQDLPRIKPHRT